MAGKRLLHLQCHFGLDTLSWARLGATVTGVDFSGRAIALARRLAAECGLPATFVESDLYELPGYAQLDRRWLGQRFDVVYTSWGVLCWLPDLARWARLIADYLAPGGIFYIAEFHPFLFALADDSEEPRRGPRRLLSQGRAPAPGQTTARAATPTPAPTSRRRVEYEWDHPLGEIVTALIEAGLTIEYLHEFRRLGSRQTLDWPCIGSAPTARLPCGVCATSTPCRSRCGRRGGADRSPRRRRGALTPRRRRMYGLCHSTAKVLCSVRLTR